MRAKHGRKARGRDHDVLLARAVPAPDLLQEAESETRLRGEHAARIERACLPRRRREVRQRTVAILRNIGIAAQHPRARRRK